MKEEISLIILSLLTGPVFMTIKKSTGKLKGRRLILKYSLKTLFTLFL